MRTIHRDIVSALLFSKDNKILFGKKHPEQGGVYIDCWHIPGGGVETGESQIETLHREILEEVGINIGRYTPELVDDTGSGESEKVLKDTGEKVLCKMHFIVYKVVIADRNADEILTSTSDDLEKISWFSLDEIKTLELTPPSQVLFKKLGYLPFFKNSIKAVLFDMDGLMIDSESFYCKAYNQILKQYGFGLTAAENNARYVGISDKDICRDLITRYGLKITVAELETQKVQLSLDLMSQEVKPQKGLIDLIKYLAGSGKKLGIASGSSKALIKSVIDALEISEFFEIYCSAEEVENGKPAPDLYNYLAERLKVNPSECLVLEDAPSGLKAAKSAGMYCFVIPSRETKDENFEGADQILTDLSQVTKFV